VAQRPETRGNVAAFLQRCEADVFTANVASSDRETSSSLHAVMQDAARDLDPSKPRAARGVSTGLHELDELSLGMGPGELWYIAGRPGMGKTALALNIAAAVAASARHAAVFSLEMTRAELGERMISSHSGVRYKSLQKRELTQADWSTACSSLDTLARLPMHVDDDRHLTPSLLRSRVRRHASAMRAKDPTGRLALVVVDYVQLMAWDKPSGNRNDELERISRALKIMAGEFGVTVLALAQLNRGQKDRADKRPSLMDLRGSGALEQDADKVLFIHRDETEGEERGDAELILAKGRNAGTGSVTVRWQPWCVRFTDSAQSGFDWGPHNYDD
jgi:replicative DNA helicase